MTPSPEHASAPRTKRLPGRREGTRSSSRAATDRLLCGLRDEGWTPAAWARFLGRATLRSASEAIRHAPALAEATALHWAFALAAPPRRRLWVAASWALTVTHLGMLEDRRTLGPANILTLVRANLPALQDRLGPLLPIAALVTDFLDGRISRATATQTPFGRDADFIADAAVWNWHAAQEPSAFLRLATAVVWAGPIAAVVVSSFAGGAMKDVPRSPWIRPAAALQVLLAARALLRPAIAARRDLDRTGFCLRRASRRHDAAQEERLTAALSGKEENRHQRPAPA